MVFAPCEQACAGGAALQRAADIIVQKSVREGFGLTVTEAMWKGKPVIGGAAGGISGCGGGACGLPDRQGRP